MKWIKKEKLRSPLYVKGIFYRVFESFEYIIDIEVERLEEIKSKAEEESFKLKEISSVPLIFFNPFNEVHSFI
jgi:hypothetical protein